MQDFFSFLDKDKFLIFAFLYIVIGSFLYIFFKSLKKWYEVYKENMEKQSACEKAKLQDLKNRWTDYFWSSPIAFININIIFIIVYELSIWLYETTDVILYILIVTLYLAFLKFSIDKFFYFPIIANKKLQEHKDAIIDSVCKDLQQHKNDQDITIKECKDNIIIHQTATEKFNYPPFIVLDKAKRQVVSKTIFQVIALEKEFMMICPNTTEFNLLKPVRADKVKKCVIVRGIGDCEDIFYSDIRDIVYEDGAIKIDFFDNRKPKIIAKVAKKEDAKTTILKIKERRRLIESQKINRASEAFRYNSCPINND